MPHDPAAIPPDSETERSETDSSLRAERAKTDDEFEKARGGLDGDADEVLQNARELADETLEAARSKADAKMKTAGASVADRATVEAGQQSEDVALVRARRAADEQLTRDRAAPAKAIANVLGVERKETDAHLAAERALSDQGLELILTQLGQAVRLRDEFLSLASHELKTPLTPLTLSLELLLREASKQPDTALAKRVTTYIAAAQGQVRKLSMLVADLLQVSSLASAELELTLELVDFGAVVRGAVESCRPQAESAGCHLELDAPSIVGRWDALRLVHTVTKLLENAIKYGPGKPIQVRLRLTAGKARLTVEDAGIGIADEHLSRIFERFGRAVSERNYGGFGLGLYLCRTYVEAMGGTIGVESALGRGSTFRVELPVV